MKKTTDELRDKKDQVQKDIAKMLDQFEAETGLFVTRVKMKRDHMAEEGYPIHITIKATV